MKGIIYTRVSSDEQVDGTSLASQDELCRKYCEQKGIEVVEAFREEGQSAKDLSLKNRAQFLAALAFCKKRKDINAFVVFKVDRFARNTEDHFAVRRLLAECGTSLHSVTEPIGDRPAEKFIETVLAGASEYDNAIRKQRCVDGMVARMNQGIWPFKPPVGYVCARHRSRGEKKNVADTPDPELFALIRRALLGYASGEIASQSALASQLNTWGFARHTGRRVTPQLVDHLLGRHLPFFSGIIVNPWTGDEIAGAHKPMISSEDALRIRRRRSGLDPKAPMKRAALNPSFPLRRLLKCVECGRFLTAAMSRGNGGKYGYYYCFNKACSRRSTALRSDELHVAFDAYLRRLLRVRKANLPTIRALVTDLLSKRGTKSVAEQQRAQQSAELSLRRHRIFEMREDGSYDQGTFRERLRDVDAEIAQLTPLPSDRSLGDLDTKAAPAAAQWFLDNVFVVWKKLDPTNRLRFERIAFPSGIRHAQAEGFRTTKPGLVFDLLRAGVSGKSSEVHLEGISSNQLYDYFEELVSFYHDMRDATPEQADLRSAA